MEAVTPGLHLLCDCTQTKGTRQVAVLAPATYDELSRKWQRDDTLSHQLPQKLEFRLVTRARVALVSAQQRVRLRCVHEAGYEELRRWAAARLNRDNSVSLATWPGGCLIASLLEPDGTLVCEYALQPSAKQRVSQAIRPVIHLQREATHAGMPGSALSSPDMLSMTMSPQRPPQPPQPPQRPQQSSPPSRINRWELACDSALEQGKERREARAVQWEETTQLLRLQHKVKGLQADVDLLSECNLKRSHPEGEAAMNLLVHRLLDAQPRVITLLTGGMVADVQLHQSVAKLHDDLQRALRRYASLVHAGELKPLAEYPPPPLQPPAPLSGAARQSAHGASPWQQVSTGASTGAGDAKAVGDPKAAHKAKGRPPPPPVEELIFKQHKPYFVWFACAGCTLIMIVEIGINGGFQPFVCARTDAAGISTNEDGSDCEGNLMLGPRIAVLDAMGAKNDVAIFERGEWWRVLACGWLHSGLVHLALNVASLLALGVPLERVFGFWRTSVLYVLSGVFGTILSTIFLPGVVSVGASASVFGIVGAYWADLILNYVAKCDLKDTGWQGLLCGTVPNLLIGLTPWIDNWMHLGGLVVGAAVTALMLPELRASATVVDPFGEGVAPSKVKVTPLGRKRQSQVRKWQALSDKVVGHGAGFTRAVRNARELAAVRIQARVRGNLVRKKRPWWQRLYSRLFGKLNRPQKAIVFGAAIFLLIYVGGTLSAVSGGSSLATLRSCKACKSFNCVEMFNWWSCCLTSLPAGRCSLHVWGGNVSLVAQCHVSGVRSYNASCDLASPTCRWEPDEPASTAIMCKRLCSGC